MAEPAKVTGCYLHYTSRQAAQAILAAGYIQPGTSGKIYVTDDLYVTGAEAANRLSIVNKPVEGVLLVPTEEVGTALPASVEELYDGNGELLTQGGGVEYEVETLIHVKSPAWLDLSRP